MTELPVYSTGLGVYGGYPFTQEGLISVGSGKFVAICNKSGNNDEIGFVVIESDSSGNLSFGTPGTFPNSDANTNPLAYYDKSEGKIVILFDDNPAEKYIIASVSGMSVIEDGRGALVAGKTFHYGVFYDDQTQAAILCSVTSPSSFFNFFTLKLSGTTVTEYPSSTPIAGTVVDDVVKFCSCGDYALCSYASSLTGSFPEFRVLSNVGTPSFSVSSGYLTTITDYSRIRGLAGNSGTGKFIWYGLDNDLPSMIPGEIDSGGAISFGLPVEYLPEGGSWAYYKSVGSGVGAGGDTFIFALRKHDTTLAMFVADNTNLIAEAQESFVATDLLLESGSYDHVPIAHDPGIGVALAAFYNGEAFDFYDGVVTVAPILVAAPLAGFWGNHTIQKEPSSSKLVKQITSTVIPGKAGQPAVPPTPGHPAYWSAKTGSEKACKKVF